MTLSQEHQARIDAVLDWAEKLPEYPDGTIGRCGECKTPNWIKGEPFPPCDDEICTFPYWEPMPSASEASDAERT